MPAGRRADDRSRRRPRSSSGEDAQPRAAAARAARAPRGSRRRRPARSRSAGSSGRTGSHAVWSWSASRGTGAPGQPELRGLVVGDDEQRRREPSGRTHVLDVVLHAAATAADGPRRAAAGRARRPPRPRVVSRLSAEITTRPPVRVRAHVQLEPLVAAPRAPARRRRPTCRSRAATPGTAGRPRRGRCRRSAASPRSRRRRSSCAGPRRRGPSPRVEVAEPQRVDLVAGPVDRVRQQPVVRADQRSDRARRSPSRAASSFASRSSSPRSGLPVSPVRAVADRATVAGTPFPQGGV